MECCVCYNKNIMLITECNHHICLTCILKLKKDECPCCRTKFKESPKDIYLNYMVNSKDNLQLDETLSVDGGGLGIFWDAPGSNYFNLSDNVKELLEELKAVDSNTWKHIRNDINNNNNACKYNIWWLRDLIDSKMESTSY